MSKLLLFAAPLLGIISFLIFYIIIWLQAFDVAGSVSQDVSTVSLFFFHLAAVCFGLTFAVFK